MPRYKKILFALSVLAMLGLKECEQKATDCTVGQVQQGGRCSETADVEKGCTNPDGEFC